MRHVHIPIFVPHLGCPHTCVFCNQHSITGKERFRPEDVPAIIEQTLATVPEDTHKEIAFFGGSFTAIDRELMTSLLALAKEYVDQKLVHAIRLSTRPDAIDEETVSILKRYPVTTVELGIQSTSDEVLSAAERGHTAKDAEKACRLLKENGFSVVGQMMVGLPQSSLDKELATANDMIGYGIDASRIYPTVVFPHTALDKMRQSGSYTPLSVEDAAERTAALLEVFYENAIDVIRVGLCESEILQSTQGLAGAYHPALGELCQNTYFRRRIEKALDGIPLTENTEVTVFVSHASLSQAIGQKRKNLAYFQSLYPLRHFTIKPSSDLNGREFKIHTKEN